MSERDDALEEAAKVADRYSVNPYEQALDAGAFVESEKLERGRVLADRGKAIARAIRALKAEQVLP